MTVDQALDSDFLTLADPYRRELLAHCYRMMGSIHDAEDQVQETFIRAWRGFDGYKGQSSLRTWLYRIATNTCLTALDGRSRRPLPTGLGAPSSDPADDLIERNEIAWLEPIADSALGDVNDPAVMVVNRDSVRLALVAALQHLSARQRAVLVLRDVLQWKASEVAEALDTTTTAVNSLLQRARAQINHIGPTEDDLVEPTTEAARKLLRDYVHSFESYDVEAIVELFTREAIWEMPPFEGWYQGPEAIGQLIGTKCPADGPGAMRLLPTAANGQPAFGLYMREPDGVHRAFQLHVLDVTESGISHVTCFFDLSLFARFGLPAEL
ncbi:sigma-70 family RNA polymerase sigma factor [Rhodococcus erythropolis]|jgi:RNA polymerase sigma-70 factor (ECF subfamily)|uniref:sigma-70 family RNA polymerase sigma factor n=1 Tax=Rhodococcus erythropolis TaxID=1833 RepID=UPI00197E209B|nr:sigma-70 family RNA polymerase sigma factor [Rhodococcus erythropolis]MBY6383794.1 sigma-70 family RNA polymerase sigma factor [Rhodococcus erythropolis]MCS4257972.1 RNA polymerase sigma-70 factor (ECF subfamily) [Rhodococcus erythropolis]MCW2425689.1 RNA polymerase sigma-70 factor (ECF subfamily) [Rhodococcus erythropolis]MCZ4566175.1 sigma-70 family RNA polymerase sigma factor [Rhodococcus erythropolis]QSE39508.1 sigma-70 family RNA polymerase sigma factor [Rhodococcus erythropolis]